MGMGTTMLENRMFSEISSILRTWLIGSTKCSKLSNDVTSSTGPISAEYSNPLATRFSA